MDDSLQLIWTIWLTGLRTANDNMDKLMNRLERLSVSIGELNPAASAPTTPSTTGTAKKSERHHAGS
jgi:hypothetical protein